MGWQSLKSILDENTQATSQETTNCPECDFPGLKENKDRELLCPICGWRGNK